MPGSGSRVKRGLCANAAGLPAPALRDEKAGIIVKGRGEIDFIFLNKKGALMSVFQVRKEELEKHEFMMGTHRGRLAVTLDLLTEAMVLVGQHSVYCRSQLNPGQPAMDIRLINQSLGQAKELIQHVMEELRAERDRQRAQ